MIAQKPILRMLLPLLELVPSVSWIDMSIGFFPIHWTGIPGGVPVSVTGKGKTFPVIKNLLQETMGNVLQQEMRQRTTRNTLEAIIRSRIIHKIMDDEEFARKHYLQKKRENVYNAIIFEEILD